MFLKLIKLFFLFCLFLFTVSLFLIQTEFAKEKFKNLLIANLEKRLPVEISIEKLDGIIPFYLTFREVDIKQGSDTLAIAHEIKVVTSPLTLFSRPLVIHRVKVKEGWVKGIGFKANDSSAWPALPLGLAIDEVAFDTLQVADLPSVRVVGSVAFEPKNRGKDFFIHLKIQDSPSETEEESIPFVTLKLLGDGANQTITTSLEVKDPPNLQGSVALNAVTNYPTLETKGNLSGQGVFPPELKKLGNRWELHSNFALSSKLELTLNDLALTASHLQLQGNGHFSLDAQGLAGSMAARGALMNRPLAFHTELTSKDTSTLSLNKLSLNYLDASLAGDLTILFPPQRELGPLFVGTLEGSFHELAPLFTLLGPFDTPLYGRAEGKLVLQTFDLKQQKITFALQASDLQYKEFSAQQGTLEGSFLDFDEGEMSGAFSKVSLAEAKLDTLETNLSFQKEGHLVFDVNLEGNQTISGTYNQPTETLTVNAKMSRFALNTLFPDYLEGGSATGSLELKGPLSNLEGTFSLTLDNIDFHDCPYEVFPNFDFSLQGALKEHHLHFEGVATGLGSEPLKAKGSIPIVLQFPKFALEKELPFSLKLEGKGRIDPLLSFLERAALISRGVMELDLQLTGTINAPTLEGFLVISEGFIEDLTTGAILKNLSISMVGKGQDLFIGSLKAYDLDEGVLEGSGRVLWDPQNHFPFVLKLHANRFDLFTVDPLTVKASGDFEIEGNLETLSISGKATIANAHLAIPDKLPTQVPSLEVTYLNPLEEDEFETPTDKKIAISWDLAIAIPNHFFLEGRGLNSEWAGNLTITGTSENLSYKGDLKAIKGSLCFADRVFTLQSGRVKIEGLKPKEIYLNLQTQADFPAMTVIVGLTGTVEAPDITLSSSPPMATNQILSWILFNTDLNELTPFQACRLAHLLVKLSGTYTGPGIFSSIKEGLGLDVFDITHCDIDAADVTFQVGKYISEGVFVGVNKSISGDADALTIQTRLFRNFFLQADYGTSINDRASGTGKLILKWYNSY